MKLLFYPGLFFACIFFLSSCKKGNIGGFDSTIEESASNPNKFRQITFTLNISTADQDYLTLVKLDSVKIRVNGKSWGVFSSETIDTTGKGDKVIRDVRYSRSKVSYLIIAPYTLNPDKLETAGDYLNYLNQRIVLSPGDYVAEITEIKFKNLKGEWLNLKPQVYKDFLVIPNTTSSFAGDINIIIK